MYNTTKLRLPLRQPAVSQALSIQVADADPGFLAFGVTSKNTPIQAVGRCADLDLAVIYARRERMAFLI
jgi:hypothetical protein